MRLFSSVVFAVALLVPAPVSSQPAEGPAFHQLWRQGGDAGMAGWQLDGVRVEDGRFALGGEQSAQPLESVATRELAVGGVALGPEQSTAEPILELIPSWNAETPPGSWIEVRLRARVGGRWTGWYALAIWSSDGPSELRRSVRGQDDADARVLTDTLALRAPADAFQLSLGLFAADARAAPTVSLVTVLASRPSPTARSLARDGVAWGTVLAVPERSQMVYPGGGEVWCSPTSTSMVLGYWADLLGASGLDRAVPVAAAGTYDVVYRGHGNWPFNTAFAAQTGLVGYVSRFSSVGQLERWIEAGAPVVASLAWQPGELANAPIGSTNGHLLVVVGFTADGDVVVNEPAADPRRGQSVRRVYARHQFERLWLRASGGAVYLIHPGGWSRPTEDALGAW